MEELKESLFIRISHPWEKVETLVDKWSKHFSACVVYEHEADEEVKRTHCHMVITGLSVGRKRLRQIADAIAFPIKGNENCSIVAYDGGEVPYVYMAKGSLEPVYSRGFDQSHHTRWKDAWVIPNARESKLPKIEEMYDSFRDKAHKTSPNWTVLKDNVFRHVKQYRRVCDNQFFQYYKAIVITYMLDYEDFIDYKIPRSDAWFAKGLPDTLLEKKELTQFITHPSGLTMEL